MAVKNVRRYFPGLEGIRAVAALLVLLNHAGIYLGIVGSSLFGVPGKVVLGSVFNRFEVGLPIFFLLSGMLIFRPYALAILEGTARPSVIPYFWRRALRIVPAYWLMTPVALVLLNWSTLTGVWPVLRPLLFLQVYQPNAIPSGMGQTWSLPSEVAFYILLPAFAILAGRSARRATSPDGRTRRLMILLAALITIGLAYTVYTHLPAVGPYPTQFLWLPEYVGFFSGGMILAVLSARAELESPETGIYALMRRPLLCWGIALAAFVAVCTPLAGSATIDYPGVAGGLIAEILYLIFGFFLLMPLTLPGDRSRVIDSIVANPVMLFLGRISYGIFLWQLVFLDGYYKWSHTRLGTGNFWVVISIPLFGSIAVATISYYLVERPLMRLRPRLGRAPSAPSMPVPVIESASNDVDEHACTESPASGQAG